MGNEMYIHGTYFSLFSIAFWGYSGIVAGKTSSGFLLITLDVEGELGLGPTRRIYSGVRHHILVIRLQTT